MGGVLPHYNGLYWDALSKKGTFFRLEIYKRVGISRVDVTEKGEERNTSIIRGVAGGGSPGVPVTLPLSY